MSEKSKKLFHKFIRHIQYEFWCTYDRLQNPLVIDCFGQFRRERARMTEEERREADERIRKLLEELDN